MPSAPSPSRDLEYAVVGAGPAGAMAACALASIGRDVALFHWAPSREKPCGGGVPVRGMQLHGSFLEGTPRNEIAVARIADPRGQPLFVELDQPLAIFSRRELDETLRRRAVTAGAQRIDARVSSLRREQDGYTLAALDRDRNPTRYRTRFLVVADGARGATKRQLFAAHGWSLPDARHFSNTHTTYPAACGSSSVLDIAYLNESDGYAWTFPRLDHASIGICRQGDNAGAASLRRELGELVESGRLRGDLHPPQGIGAAIPSFRGATLRQHPVEGPRCALVGDAAGAVDPITREGIHYAMASGHALGELDPLHHPGRYGQWFDEEIRGELEIAGRMATRFFSPLFLRAMNRCVSISPRVRMVLRDLIAGAQPYRTLRSRLLRCLPDLALGVALPRRR